MCKEYPQKVKLKNYYESNEYAFLQLAISEIKAGARSTKEVTERLCKQFHFDYLKGRKMLEDEGYLGEHIPEQEMLPMPQPAEEQSSTIGKTVFHVENGSIYRGTIVKYTVEFLSREPLEINDPFTDLELCLTEEAAKQRLAAMEKNGWDKEFASMSPEKIEAFKKYIGAKK